MFVIEACMGALLFCSNKTVIVLIFKKIIFEIKSYDGFCYICLTCSKKIKKGDIPCQAIWNDLKLFVFPNEIANLNKLEKSLICK